MARVHTHYDNLKVARNAPPEVIRAAYKTLSQKYHPDRNSNSREAIRITQIINSAYEVLSDPVKRQEHDDWIAREEGKAERGAAASNINSSFSAADAMRSAAAWPQSHKRRRRHKRTLGPQEFMQFARMILDRFSKYIFRKV